MKPILKRTALLTVCGLMLITVTGCATGSKAPDFCSSYQTVPTLECGTETQQLMVDTNNAIFMEQCGG